MRTKSGRTLSEADIERLAEEAERGFDLATWKPQPGRPRLDPTTTGHSPRVAARVAPRVYALARRRAAAEGRSISEVVRDLLETYAAGADGPGADGAHAEVPPVRTDR